MATVEYVAFDLETTGLSPRSDRVVEIGAVRFDAEMRRLGELEVLVDPGMPIPLPVQRLCGISDADVAGAPSPAEGMAVLADFCSGAQLVAHGSGFDIAFCASLAPEAFAGRRVLDTLEVARVLLPMAPSHSLPLLSLALGHEHLRPHRALSDASATHLLFAHLRARGAALPSAVLTEMRRVAATGAVELDDFLSSVVPGDGDPQAAVWQGAPPPAPRPPTPLTSPGDLEAAAAAVFAPGGPLDRDGASFEVREAQVHMARAVAQSLQRGRRLLVEAGTGVGKSLAYLVPLALHAREGRRAVVATRTVTLQEQLVHRELPLVERLLEAPLSVAMLKGRSHYLSLRRWRRFLANPPRAEHGSDPDRIRFTLRILAWLAETRSGDRAELHLGGNDMDYWRLVQSENDDCLGSACANWRSARCFMVAARRGAADADMVVTNHALLVADAAGGGQVLGVHEALVVDEAHHLEEAATEQLGTALRAADVQRVVDRLPAPDAAGLAEVGPAATRLFGDVKGRIGEVLGSDQPGNASVAITEASRQDPALGTLQRSARHAVAVWRDAAAHLRTAPASGAQAGLFPDAAAGDERENAAQALEGLAAVVERILLHPRAGHVCWLATRAEQGELHEAPIVVADRLRESVFDGPSTVIATSATLAVNGDFSFAAGRLGLGGADELVLGSPYDFLEQALCVLPRGIPPYDDAAYDETLAAIVGDAAVALEGGTLALFTGYAPLRRVHALLGRRLQPHGIALLGQGLDGTRRQVLSSFLANRRSLLLGTSTFWEGIDVPGEALQCVVVAKLPFAVPTDPLVGARTAGLADPFGDYILPQAVLRLRQGFGRLIRRGSDRGAVVLCDERLDSREYGERFLGALPPAAVVRVAPQEVGRVVRAFVVDRVTPEGARTPVQAGQSAQAMESFDPA
ncbi:MAG: helicase C-terminal domain-containing protein [Candidatus Dormibacteria bacterium]